MRKEIKRLFDEIAETAGLLWEKGWAERNAGNISVRLDFESVGIFKKLKKLEKIKLDTSFPALCGRVLLITASGSRMRALARKPKSSLLFIRLDETASSYSVYTHKNSKSRLKATSEINAHLAIHQMIAERGSPEKVVMHTHATELIALTQHPNLKTEEEINRILWGMHPETMIFIPKGVGFVPYLLPGSIEIAETTIEKLKKHDLVLWEKHGVFSISKTISDAFDQVDIACKSAKIWFMCKSAGFEPEGMNQNQLNDLKKLVEKFK